MCRSPRERKVDVKPYTVAESARGDLRLHGFIRFSTALTQPL